jgi:hypothetical protein
MNSSFLKQRIFFANKPTPLLLDLHPNALAAYATKKLKVSAESAGNLRGADNSVLMSTFLGNDLNEAMISSTFGSQNVFFSSLADQTGNGKNASQPSAGKQARIAISGVIQKQSSEPVLDFDGNSLQEYSKTSETLSEFTVYLRARMTNGFTSIINQGEQPFPYLHYLNWEKFRSAGVGIEIGSPGSSYNYSNMVWVRSGSNGKFYVNGSLIGETNSLTTNNTVFSHVLGGIFGWAITGQLRAFIVYPVAHDATKISAINSLL